MGNSHSAASPLSPSKRTPTDANDAATPDRGLTAKDGSFRRKSKTVLEKLTGGSKGKIKKERRFSQGGLTSATKSDVSEKYEIDYKELGHGHYGVVRRCFNKETREPFAIKTIKKSRVSRIESLRREIEILRCVKHPCIIELIDVYEDERYIHLVTELCTGGELFDRLQWLRDNFGSFALHFRSYVNDRYCPYC
jgi:Protein kinase domain